IVGHRTFSDRIGRNESFNHAGNAIGALIAGATALTFGPTVVFYLLAATSFASLVSIWSIPNGSIDHEVARGLTEEGSVETVAARKPSGIAVLLTCRPLLIFAACVMLFHLSNAAMLPLTGQKLALQDKRLGTSLMAACIVAAQLVMV